jgi:hypothetical protein
MTANVALSRCLATTGADITRTFLEIWARATGAAQPRPSALAVDTDWVVDGHSEVDGRLHVM